MPEQERAARCRSLARAATAVPPSLWFSSQLAALDDAEVA
jgi:trehalose 6-phosphate synthase